MTRIVRGPPLKVPDETIPQQFFRSVRNQGSRTCFRTRTSAGGDFENFSYNEVAEWVTQAGNGLLALGFEPGQKWAILSDTRYEWQVADLGILSAGGVTVTIYPTLTADQIEYLLNDSGSVGLFVSDQEQFDKVAAVFDKAESLKHVVTFEDIDTSALKDHTLSLKDLRAKGAAYAQEHPDELKGRWEPQKGDALCTIVYTSGTTGVPKGALLTHGNFVAAAAAADKQLSLRRDLAKLKEEDQISLSFLPLAHCYQRLVNFMSLELGVTLAFTNPANMGRDLVTVQPALMASVPRLYERMYNQILKNVSEAPEKRQRIFEKAAQTAREYGAAINDGGSAGFGLKARHKLYDALVFKKIRERLGATRMVASITGSAAIRPDLLFFFRGIGIPILEGYGLTETSAPSNVNPPHKFKVGTVGPPFPGMEMKLDDDGEILMKGPNVFLGYYNLPKETAESFTEDGWFRTGDIGVFDEDGYLKIVDRKKEIEVLNTGKKVAPVNVEEALKVNPLVGEVCLVGTDRPFLGALIQPNYDALVDWAAKNGVEHSEERVVREPDPTGQIMTYAVGEDLLQHPKVQELYQGVVDENNKQFADFEQVKVWRLVPHTFTVARDELTPTFKKKRRVVLKNYEKLVDDMFTSAKKK